MQEIKLDLDLSCLKMLPTVCVLLFSMVWLTGCASSQALKSTDNAVLTWNGTEDVRFVMAYKEETNTGYRLSGMVKDARGRHHKLSKSHVDVKFIGLNDSVVYETQSRFRPLPRPRVVHRLARFSLDYAPATTPILEIRLHYHEAENHEVR